MSLAHVATGAESLSVGSSWDLPGMTDNPFPGADSGLCRQIQTADFGCEVDSGGSQIRGVHRVREALEWNGFSLPGLLTVSPTQ